VRLANTDAPINDQRAPDTEQRPPIDYVEPGAPAVITNPITRPIDRQGGRSEEHTSELQSQSLISYAVFCLKKKKKSL